MNAFEGTTLNAIVGDDRVNADGYVLFIATLPEGVSRVELVAPCGDIIGAFHTEAYIPNPLDSEAAGTITVTEIAIEALIAQIVDHAIVCGRVN